MDGSSHGTRKGPSQCNRPAKSVWQRGARRAAVLYTLVVSCKELGLNPFDYLRDVIVKAGDPDFPASRIAELTPIGWARSKA